MTPFVLNMVFQHVGLFCIINSNNYLNFEVKVLVSQWMDKGQWYNTTNSSNLNSQILYDYFKTGRKDRYDLMCSVSAYNIEHVLMPGDAISGDGI